MSRRLCSVVLLGVVALAGAAGCADDVSPAVEVGDVRIGNDALIDEVAEWAGNPQAVNPDALTGFTEGTYPIDLVNQILQQRIEFELHRAEFDRLDLQLDDDLRQRALAFVLGDPAAADQAFAAFSDDFADAFVDDVARQLAVSDELGQEGYAAWRTEAMTSDIEVNPRYGTWNAESGSIDSPSGPTQPVADLGA